VESAVVVSVVAVDDDVSVVGEPSEDVEAPSISGDADEFDSFDGEVVIAGVDVEFTKGG
jgi:hypothetical protein